MPAVSPWRTQNRSTAQPDRNVREYLEPRHHEDILEDFFVALVKQDLLAALMQQALQDGGVKEIRAAAATSADAAATPRERADWRCMPQARRTPCGRDARVQATDPGQPPYLAVLRRTEELAERKLRRRQGYAAAAAVELAKQVTLKPELTARSRKLMEGKHVKPWEIRSTKHECIAERRLREDLWQVQARREKNNTFHPQINCRSRELFCQFADTGETWYERMFQRSKEARGDRLGFSTKKATREMLENLRDPVPAITTRAKRRPRSAEDCRSVHMRLYQNTGLSKEARAQRRFSTREATQEMLEHLRDPVPVITTRARRRPRSAEDFRSVHVRLYQNTGSSKEDNATSAGSTGELSPGQTEFTASPYRSPAKGLLFQDGMAATTPTSLGSLQDASPTPHCLVANTFLLELLAACRPYASGAGLGSDCSAGSAS